MSGSVGGGTIYVDDRVGSVEVAEYLSDPVVMRLKSGDFCWEGQGPEGPVMVGVERKRLRDFINSVESGRLTNQLLDMQCHYHFLYLVVEGGWYYNKAGMVVHHRKLLKQGTRTFNRKYLDRAINSIAVCAGVFVVRCSSLEDTAGWLESVVEWWQKDWDKHTAYRVIGSGSYGGNTVLLKRPSYTLRMIAQLPGIGWLKAVAIEKEFKTMRELVRASSKDIQKVDGIGKTLSESIRRVLHGR
jgi:ERCC4-type nuclease